VTEPEPDLRTSLYDERTAVHTPMDGPAWSPARRDRRARLAAVSRDIAELYEAAIDILGDPGSPARMLLLGHCMREISNRLPDILNPELPDSSKQNLAVEQLAKAWRASGLGAQLVGADESTQAPDVSVPRGVAAAIETVVAEYEVGRRANYAKGSFLVQGVVPPNLAGTATNPDPSVQAFLRSKRFFMDYTHAGDEDRPPPREEEIQDRVRHFEDVLDARLGDWWAVQAEVRDLVTRANERHSQTAGGSGDRGDQRQWSLPNDELVQEALRRIGDPQHRRAFFLELANPLWVEPLRRAGLFRTAPALQAAPDGAVQVTPWAQSQYLARMAAEAPEDVAQAFEAMDDGGNPAVHRDLVDAASHMPARVAKRLVPRVVEYLHQPFRTLIDPDALARLLSQLARDAQTRPASQLAEALYAPQRVEHPTEKPVLPEVTAGLDAPSYQMTLAEVVPALVDGLKVRALRITVFWLETWQRETGYTTEDGSADGSYIWRPSIAPHAQNPAMGMGDALVDAVRDISWTLVQQGTPPQDVLAILDQSPQPVMRRIGFHLLAQLISEAEPDAVVITLAAERLNAPSALDSDVRHEYAELARAALVHLDLATRSRWEEMIAQGPLISDEELRARIARHREVEEHHVGQDEVDQWRRSWQRDVLAAVRDALSPEAGARLTALEAEFGVRPHPDFPSWMEMGWGLASPVRGPELAAMSVDEQLDYLRTWTPDATQPFGPSRQGLGRELTEVIHADPVPLGTWAAELARGDPTYVRAALQGWELAVRDGARIPWASILDLLEFVAAQPDEGDPPSRAARDHDPVWRWAHQGSATLLRQGLLAGRESSPPADLRERLWAVIERLTNSPDPSTEHEAQSQGDTMDPIRSSLNVVRGQAMRAVMDYLSWLATQELVHPGLHTVEAAPEVFAVLDAHLEPERDPSAAIRSVYGEHLPFLLHLAPDWVQSRRERIFGIPDTESSTPTERALGDAAWAAFVSRYGPSRTVFEALADHYRARVRRMQIPSTVRRAGSLDALHARLAEHILLLYTQGVIGLDTDDGLVALFFSTADLLLRREALSHLGWLVFRSEERPSPEVLDRLQSLWDWRERRAEETGDDGELGAFSWWFLSPHFSEEWSVPHLVRAASASGQLEMPVQVAARLSAIAARHPTASLAVLDVLTNADPGNWQTSTIAVQHASRILATGLRSEDATVQQRARRLLDRLGRQGHFALKDQVDALLSGESAPR